MTPTAPEEKGKGKEKESAQDRLMNAAAILFYNNGINATGIDAIVKKAEVAKKSLYNNFASKAELVTQYLQRRHNEWLKLYKARIQQATNPTERVLAVFDAYTDHAEYEHNGTFRGCGLLNAAAEFPAGAADRKAVRAHKEEVEALLHTQLIELMPNNAAHTARHLAFLLEGAIVRAGLEGNSKCVTQARHMAAALLAAT